jgi:guanylate kinase
MPEWKKQKARQMRRHPTRTEAMLWGYLRRRQLGVKFRRQAPMRGWIADFYCPQLKLVIEVDGKQHDLLRDKLRDGVLSRLGFETFRFPVERVQLEPLVVVEEIRKLVAQRVGSNVSEKTKAN